MVLISNTINQRSCALYRVDGTDALSATPNIFPGLFIHIAARIEVHFAGIALWQLVGVKTCLFDRAAKVIAMYPGK